MSEQDTVLMTAENPDDKEVFESSDYIAINCGVRFMHSHRSCSIVANP